MVFAFQVTSQNEGRQASSNRIQTIVPAFKPFPPGGSRPMAQRLEHQYLVVQQNSTNVLKTMPGPTFSELQQDAMKQKRAQAEAAALRQRDSQHQQQEFLAIKMLNQQRQQQFEANRFQQQQQRVQLPQQALQPAVLSKRIQVNVTEDNGKNVRALYSALPY